MSFLQTKEQLALLLSIVSGGMGNEKDTEYSGKGHETPGGCSPNFVRVLGDIRGFRVACPGSEDLGKVRTQAR